MHNPSSLPRVVLCGEDELLLRTRALVLEYAGFRVTSIIGIRELAGVQEADPAALVVLCHSLGVTGLEEASQLVGAVWPASRVLAVTTHARPIPDLGIPTVDAFAGPLAVVAACRNLAASGSDPQAR